MLQRTNGAARAPGSWPAYRDRSGKSALVAETQETLDTHTTDDPAELAAAIAAELAANLDNPPPACVGAVDREVIDVPDGYALRAARFFVASNGILHLDLVRAEGYAPKPWRWGGSAHKIFSFTTTTSFVF